MSAIVQDGFPGNTVLCCEFGFEKNHTCVCLFFVGLGLPTAARKYSLGGPQGMRPSPSPGPSATMHFRTDQVG